MKYPAGPVTVTPGRLRLPMPASAVVLAGGVLSNNSQFLMQVGPHGLWLQPYSAAWFDVEDLGQASCDVIASAFGGQTVIAGAQVLTAMFYSNDEAVPDVAPFAADPLAVAAGMFATGIPSVLVQQQIRSDAFGQALPASLPINGNLILGIAQFASLILQARSIFGGRAPSLVLDFYASATPNAGPNVIGTPDTILYSEMLQTADTNAQPSLAFPVNAGSVNVTNMAAEACVLTAIGSNRLVPKAMLLGDSFRPRRLSWTGLPTNGIGQRLLDSRTPGIKDNTNFNGKVLVVATSSNTVGGRLAYQLPDQAGVMTNYFIGVIPAAGTALQTEIYHPLGVIDWAVFPTSTSTTVQTTFSIDVQGQQ